jgi:hypothetical protein
MYFQATVDAGLDNFVLDTLGSGTPVAEFIYEYFGPGPLDAQNATSLMFIMARKLFNDLATDTPFLGPFGALRTPFLRYSLVDAPVPLSYLQLVYSGIVYHLHFRGS